MLRVRFRCNHRSSLSLVFEPSEILSEPLSRRYRTPYVYGLLVLGSVGNFLAPEFIEHAIVIGDDVVMIKDDHISREVPDHSSPVGRPHIHGNGFDLDTGSLEASKERLQRGRLPAFSNPDDLAAFEIQDHREISMPFVDSDLVPRCLATSSIVMDLISSRTYRPSALVQRFLG